MAHLRVENYGWNVNQNVPSNDYLEPAVVNACRRLGVSSVLDLGCGKGDIARALARSGL